MNNGIKPNQRPRPPTSASVPGGEEEEEEREMGIIPVHHQTSGSLSEIHLGGKDQEFIEAEKNNKTRASDHIFLDLN